MARRKKSYGEVPDDVFAPELQDAIASAAIALAEGCKFCVLRVNVRQYFRSNDPEPHYELVFADLEHEIASLKKRRKNDKTKLAGGRLKEKLVQRDVAAARKTQTREKSEEHVAKKWGMKTGTVRNVVKDKRFRESLKPIEQRTHARRPKKRLIPYAGKK